MVSIIIVGCLSKSSLKTLASFICWNIWKARNSAIFEGVNPDPLATIIKAQNVYEELQHITFLIGRAACFSSASPLVAEGIDLKKALIFAVDYGFLQAVMESDSLTICQLVVSTRFPIPWEIETAIQDIRQIC